MLVKTIKKVLRKSLKVFLVFILIISWTFTGLPRIPFINFPQKIQEAQAAAPTFVAAGAVASGTPAITPALPAGIAVNDILLLLLATEAQAITIPTPNGGTWTGVGPLCTVGTAAGADGAQITVFWSRYNGTQGAPTTSDSGDNQVGIIIAIRGVIDSGNPWDVTSLCGTSATAVTAGSIPGATTTVADTFIVAAIATALPDAAGTANFSGWTNTDLTNVLERTDNTASAGSGSGLGSATGEKAAAGTYGATSVTLATASQYAAMSIALKPAPPVTTISNFVTGEPANSTIAPGASAQVDSFGLQTNVNTDTVTGATVTLAAGTGARVATVAITNDGDTVTYCSAAPVGDAATLTVCGIPVTTTNTQFKVKITAISHASMPVPPGAEYAVTGTVTSFTCTNSQSGTDSGSATVTIDNASPNGATSVSGSSGNAFVTLNWTASNSTDFNTTSGSVIYRWDGGTAGSEVPVEGSTATIGAANGTATTACVVSSAISAVLSKIDGTGGSAECTTAALTNGQAYTYKAFQKDTNGNYDVGVSIGTFTPSAAAAYLTQNNFRFYLTANSVTLTDPWPSGTLDLGEKAALTQLPVQNLALVSGDKIRIKINFGVTVTNLTATTQAFQLEYSVAEDCTTASSWTAVGAKASASIWRLYDEASIGDSTIEANNLGDSTAGAEGYYSEINPSGTNPNAVNTSQYSEWDWPVQDNGAVENTTYCFRMAKSGGGALDLYGAQSYPKLTTAPGVSVLMRHGNFFQNQGEKGFFWTN